MALANARLNFILTNSLDQAVRRAFHERPPQVATKPVRLAVLDSCTLTHLLPGIRVMGLRRGIWIDTYVRELTRRGVILAVCSKNDEANALEPFDKHPDMVLRRADIASFVANWADKAGNIRAVAQELNIGLDSLVFVDDNPFERNLVRQELPMVAVPEVADDPAYFFTGNRGCRLLRSSVGNG
ncbi:MAG: hypothetical protein JO227_04470 [Acetobacteraceae bacterium]|nr:hypothetical protein [Acetobacteraceae bacterium]